MKATASGFGADLSFQRDRDAGTFARNMNRLPLLQVLDTQDPGVVVGEMGQSHTIIRFIAERHGLFGNDSLERALMDATYESVRDIRSRYLTVKMKSKWSERTEWMNKTLPRFCRMLEGSLPPPSSSPSPWLIGSKASLADIAVYGMLGIQTSVVTGSTVNFFDGMARDLIDNAYSDCPRLVQSVKATGELPAIQNWEQVRPDTFN
jgi:glutathione S-transferase